MKVKTQPYACPALETVTGTFYDRLASLTECLPRAHLVGEAPFEAGMDMPCSQVQMLALAIKGSRTAVIAPGLKLCTE